MQTGFNKPNSIYYDLIYKSPTCDFQNSLEFNILDATILILSSNGISLYHS